jgi:DNA-binding transcriptional regulator YdaS (Cro superfamily)
MSAPDNTQNILLACVELVGGMPQLAKHLRVSEQELAEWIAGRSRPPPGILLLAVEPVIAANRKSGQKAA